MRFDEPDIGFLSTSSTGGFSLEVQAYNHLTASKRGKDVFFTDDFFPDIDSPTL